MQRVGRISHRNGQFHATLQYEFGKSTLMLKTLGRPMEHERPMWRAGDSPVVMALSEHGQMGFLEQQIRSDEQATGNATSEPRPR